MNKNVTLAVFEGNKNRHDETEKVFRYMSSFPGWGHCVYIKKDFTYQDAMNFEFGGLLEFIHKDTTHILCGTWDGFIINSQFWSDNWLQYDMIGAPWPANPPLKHRVGNTGFTLQSRKFLGLAYAYRDQYSTGPADAFLCQTMYEIFNNNGVKYAPVEVAARFSWEHYIEEGYANPNSSFGFHGWVAGKTKEYFYSKYIR